MTLACGHDGEPADPPVCVHLRLARETANYWRRLVGDAARVELLCPECLRAREGGSEAAVAPICGACLEAFVGEHGDLQGTAGTPGILERPEPFDAVLVESPFPAGTGPVIDGAPIEAGEEPAWMLLREDGAILRFEAAHGRAVPAGRIKIPRAPERTPWDGHVPRPRLHLSPSGRFAGVAIDFGSEGLVVDLAAGGAVTMRLNGGDYHEGTVPFSLLFLPHRGRELLIHRTAWNRLDVSDPRTGKRLTARGPPSYRRHESRPDHFLDYFHGRLASSPGGRMVADDGWVWHPVGIPVAWDAGAWIDENVWESEDGATRRTLGYRDYYWNHGLSWINPGADDEAHLQIVEAFLLDPDIDAVVVGLDPTAPSVRALEASKLRPGFDITDPKSTVHLMPPLVARNDKPVIGIVNGGQLYDAMCAKLMDQGVCIFRNCARGTKALVRYIEARLYADSLKKQR